MNAYSLSDAPYRDGVDVRQQRVDAVMSGYLNDFFKIRYEHSFLKLLRRRASTYITYFDLYNHRGLCLLRRMEGASLAGMGAKMPNLETVAW